MTATQEKISGSKGSKQGLIAKIKQNRVRLLKNAGVGAVIVGTGLGGAAVQISNGALDQDGVCSKSGGGLDGKPPTDPADVLMSNQKNRYDLPSEEDFVESSYTTGCDAAKLAWSTFIGFSTEARKKNDGTEEQFAKSKDGLVMKSIKLHAFVVDVEPGGVETCNCKQPDLENKDVHIYLLDHDASGKALDKSECVIAEITPRVRRLMKKDSDWTVAAIKKNFLHHSVDVEGWLFYDYEHITNGKNEVTKANNLASKAVRWRKTCWEIHPITSLEIAEDQCAEKPASATKTLDATNKTEADKAKKPD